MISLCYVDGFQIFGEVLKNSNNQEHLYGTFRKILLICGCYDESGAFPILFHHRVTVWTLIWWHLLLCQLDLWSICLGAFKNCIYYEPLEIMFLLKFQLQKERRVWRYQRGNQNPYTVYQRRTYNTMVKGKSTKGQTTIHKIHT